MTPQQSSRASHWTIAGVIAAVVTIAVGLGAWLTTTGQDRVAAQESATSATGSTIPSTSTIPTTTTAPPIPTTTTAPPTPMAIPTGAVAPVISRVVTTDPVVFFTIDDGLVQDPAVIDFLREQRIPVTLFPVPGYVRQNPDYFRAIHDLGASVQDHTMTHLDLRRLGSAAQQSEICGPLDEYAAQFGARPWLFRPPFGALTPAVPTIARGCGIRAVVAWRATMNDGVLRTQGGPLQPGDIILMHFRTDLRWNLEVALNAARDAGLHPAALEQYLTPG